jgi:cytochrome c-type biogenesis protein
VQYFVSFLEGIITFISPCLLPLLPVYISYFTGASGNGTRYALRGALGFILGFTFVFVPLGAFAGLLGGLLNRYQTAVNIITGSIVVLFGLNYLGILKIGFLNKIYARGKGSVTGFFSAVLFGIIFSIGWTPCVGVFLGSALMLASQQGSALRGILALLCYSLGLGVPFLLSALLIDKLKTASDWIKKHYNVINNVSGIFLIVIGILMVTGMMGRFISILTF